MKAYISVFLLLILCCLTACAHSSSDTGENTADGINSESVENSAIENPVGESIQAVIENRRIELDISDEPFGVSAIYSGTKFDYNNDGHDDHVLVYALYSQFEFVIIDSQNADILFDERIMMDLFSQTKAEVYINSSSEYAFKFSDRIEKPSVSNIVETIQIINDSENCILEAVYDHDTNSFSHAYGIYTYDEYIHKQEELLSGYEHFADIKWEVYEDVFSGQ